MKDDLVDSELITVLELRDKFAMAAMVGLCAMGRAADNAMAIRAYELADAMLKARKEGI